MSRSNDRLNASVLETVRLSTTVHGSTLVTCTVAYCPGSSFRAIQAFTPSAYARSASWVSGESTDETALGGTADAQRPHLDVAGQRTAAEQLRERAGAAPPDHVHLEQPVVGVHPALQEEQVMRRWTP